MKGIFEDKLSLKRKDSSALTRRKPKLQFYKHLINIWEAVSRSKAAGSYKVILRQIQQNNTGRGEMAARS